MFIPELAEHATSGGLQLGFEVPECFRPKELPKVPRATIALLKAHVEEQFRIARITKKLTNTNKRTELWKNPEPGETIYMVSKALQGDLKARGALMNTTEQMFWGCMIESFKTPATLIDSCRGEFYNAAGARAGAVKAEPTPVQKIWTQKDFFIEETAEV